ncbi:MAG: hypothetical protein WC710_14065 [Gallionella sp.]|jgi:hypothetical protein
MKYKITFSCSKNGETISVSPVPVRIPIVNFVTIEIEAPENTPSNVVYDMATNKIPPGSGDIFYWDWHGAYWADPNFIPREYIPGQGFKL